MRRKQKWGIQLIKFLTTSTFPCNDRVGGMTNMEYSSPWLWLPHVCARFACIWACNSSIWACIFFIIVICSADVLCTLPVQFSRLFGSASTSAYFNVSSSSGWESPSLSSIDAKLGLVCSLQRIFISFCFFLPPYPFSHDISSRTSSGSGDLRSRTLRDSRTPISPPGPVLPKVWRHAFARFIASNFLW